ncbi:MAG: helix-turn-helix domain-containing protein [Rectinemataceae bacterium]
MKLIQSPKDLGALLRERRKALGYNQTRVASLCGTGTRFVSDLENGKPTIELGKTLVLASILGIDIAASIRGE